MMHYGNGDMANNMTACFMQLIIDAFLSVM